MVGLTVANFAQNLLKFLVVEFVFLPAGDSLSGACADVAGAVKAADLIVVAGGGGAVDPCRQCGGDS